MSHEILRCGVQTVCQGVSPTLLFSTLSELLPESLTFLWWLILTSCGSHFDLDWLHTLICCKCTLTKAYWVEALSHDFCLGHHVRTSWYNWMWSPWHAKFRPAQLIALYRRQGSESFYTLMVPPAVLGPLTTSQGRCSVLPEDRTTETDKAGVQTTNPPHPHER